MQKMIIHIGQDPEKEEFYILVVKAVDINSGKLSDSLKDDLLSRGFMIYYADESTMKQLIKIDLWKLLKCGERSTKTAGPLEAISRAKRSHTLLSRYCA